MIVFRYSVPPSWYEGVYQDPKAPCRAARPFSLVHKEGSSKAVLLVHGYAGYPGELVRPARELYEAGFDVFVPRLPGNGTTGEDFMRSRGKDWVGTIRNAAADLKARYQRLGILGHSMGAAIAVIVARELGIRRIVLAAPAISYDGQKPPKPFPVMYLFSLVRKRIPTAWHHQSEYVMYYEDAPADDDYLGGQYWSWVYIRQVYELMRLMKLSSKALQSIDADILTISGGRDRIVGSAPSEAVMRSGKGEREHLHIPECTHFVYYDADKGGEEKAVEASVRWLSAL